METTSVYTALVSVSYTHLDVYKRQQHTTPKFNLLQSELNQENNIIFKAEKSVSGKQTYRPMLSMEDRWITNVRKYIKIESKYLLKETVDKENC